MQPFTTLDAKAAPLDIANLDTDQIIPKQFLKRIERTGFGPFLFHDWRKDPGFVLNRPEHAGAKFLVTGANFGCGSSREHAPWALEDAGFRAVIAPSFADIFKNNCLKLGLLPVQLPEEQVRRLLALAETNPSLEVTVDLAEQTVTADGFEAAFEIDAFSRICILEGLDEIALTMRQADITTFEETRAAHLPRVV